MFLAGFKRERMEMPVRTNQAHGFASGISAKHQKVCGPGCVLVCWFAGLLVCLFACLLVCLFACLLVCLFACLLVCLFLFLLVGCCCFAAARWGMPFRVSGMKRFWAFPTPQWVVFFGGHVDEPLVKALPVADPACDPGPAAASGVRRVFSTRGGSTFFLLLFFPWDPPKVDFGFPFGLKKPAP